MNPLSLTQHPIHSLHSHAAPKPLINSIQTKEDLDELLQDLDELSKFSNQNIDQRQLNWPVIRRIKVKEAQSDFIYDPPVIQQKGRPWSAGLTGAIEGRPCRGPSSVKSRAPSQMALPTATMTSQLHVAQKARRRCGLCQQEGHTRQNRDWVQEADGRWADNQSQYFKKLNRSN